VRDPMTESHEDGREELPKSTTYSLQKNHGNTPSPNGKKAMWGQCRETKEEGKRDWGREERVVFSGSRKKSPKEKTKTWASTERRKVGGGGWDELRGEKKKRD